MPALATTGGRRHLVVLHVASPLAGNWQQLLAAAAAAGAGFWPVAGPENSSEPTVAADKELAQPSVPAPAQTPAVALERTYRSAGRWAEQMCSVCLWEVADGDIVRVLIACRHCFHTACIKPWLHEGDTCPLCRAPTTAKGGRNMAT
ncbi:E3 ubiquitin-protein ligase Os03g0188200-like [Miscanthus floridulus]|uniref:E3 ubiquitin-protein ligase Os03g0188200-like n=1 Tax=Miscanthus floridulus TaxID=154761 RepID=UPI003458CFE6